jgi:bacterial/archaeal transporter family-2 protein
MHKAIFCILALLGGGFIAMQAPVNAQLAAGLKNPIVATTISFFVGFVCLLAVTLALRAPLPASGMFGTVPTYAWFLGGLLGAVFVGLNLYLVPTMGVAALMGLVITGQLIVSVLLDHFGLFGLSVHSINVGRVFGLTLLTGGAALVLRF